MIPSRRRKTICEHYVCSGPRRLDAEEQKLTAPQTADDRPEPKTEQTKQPRSYLPVRPPGVPRVNCLLDEIIPPVYISSNPPGPEDSPRPYQEKPKRPEIQLPMSKYWKSLCKNDWQKEEDSKPAEANRKQIPEDEKWQAVDETLNGERTAFRNYASTITQRDEYGRYRQVLEYPPWTCDKSNKPPYLHPYFDDPYWGIQHYPIWMYGKVDRPQYHGPGPRGWDQSQQAQGSKQPHPAYRRGPDVPFGMKLQYPDIVRSRPPEEIESTYQHDYQWEWWGPSPSSDQEKKLFVGYDYREGSQELDSKLPRDYGPKYRDM